MSPLPLVAAGLAATAVGLVAVKAFAAAKGQVGTAGPLSARRKFVLDAIASVVPSQYGDEKFKRIAPGYDPDDPALPHGFTTCGYLPCFVGRELGVGNCITQGGLEQMRMNGRKIGAWVEPTGKNRPRPGDLYAVDSQIGEGPGARRIITHVGVIVDVNGNNWRTADAGQGTIGAGQASLYLERVYDPSTNRLKTIKPAYNTPAKNLAGWIDIDKVPGVKSPL